MKAFAAIALAPIVVLAMVSSAGCGGGGRSSHRGSGDGATQGASAQGAGTQGASSSATPGSGAAGTDNGAGAPMPNASVTLYFPSASDDKLVGEPRDIVATGRPAERAAQIVSALIAGPQSAAGLPAVPAGTSLHRLWVRDDGTAYADFSDALTKGMSGGVSDEILTLYAIVDSLALNVPEIQRVAILIDGRERDTLGGHIDVRLPLPPDRSLVPAAKP